MLTRSRRDIAERIAGQVLVQERNSAPHLVCLGDWGSGKSHVLAAARSRIESADPAMPIFTVDGRLTGIVTPADLFAQHTAGSTDEDTPPPEDSRAAIIVDALHIVLARMTPAERKRFREFFGRRPWLSLIASSSASVETQAFGPFAQLCTAVRLDPMDSDEVLELAEAWFAATADTAQAADDDGVTLSAVGHSFNGNSRLVLAFLRERALRPDAPICDVIRCIFQEEMGPHVATELERMPAQHLRVLRAVAAAHGAPLTQADLVQILDASYDDTVEALIDYGYLVRSSMGNEDRFEIACPLLRTVLELRDGDDGHLERRFELLLNWYGALEAVEAAEAAELLVSFPALGALEALLEKAYRFDAETEPDGDDRIREAENLMEAGAYAEALDVFNELTLEKPHLLTLWVGRVAAHYGLESYENALYAAEELVQYFDAVGTEAAVTAIVAGQVFQATLCEELGWRDEADEVQHILLNVFRDIDSDDIQAQIADAQLAKAAALAHQKRHGHAIATYEAVAEQAAAFGGPQCRDAFVAALLGAAESRLQRGEDVEALGDVERVLAVAPAHPVACALRFQILQDIGHEADAKRMIARVVKSDSVDDETLATTLENLLYLYVNDNHVVKRLFALFESRPRVLAAALTRWFVNHMAQSDNETAPESFTPIIEAVAKRRDTLGYAADLLLSARDYAESGPDALVRLPRELRELVAGLLDAHRPAVEPSLDTALVRM